MFFKDIYYIDLKLAYYVYIYQCNGIIELLDELLKLPTDSIEIILERSCFCRWYDVMMSK